MKYITRVIGLEETVVALNRKIKRIGDASLSGLIKAAEYIKGQALPITPIDLGNLRVSSFVTWGGQMSGTNATFTSSEKNQGLASRMANDHTQSTTAASNRARSLTLWRGPTVMLGYSAFYALYVHEGNQMHLRGENKFLQKAMGRNEKQILEIIKKDVEKSK